MAMLVMLLILASLFWLLGFGGCDYHKVENGHVPSRFKGRRW